MTNVNLHRPRRVTLVETFYYFVKFVHVKVMSCIMIQLGMWQNRFYGSIMIQLIDKIEFMDYSVCDDFPGMIHHHDTHLNPAAVYVHGPRVFTQEQHPTRSLDGNVQVACLGKTKFRLSCANTFKHHDTHLNPAAVYVHGPRVFTQKQHPTRSLDGNVQVACLGKTKFRLSCANTFKHHDTHLNPAAVYVHGPRVFTQKQHPTRSLDGNVQVACLGKTKFRLSCANTFKHHDTHLNPAAVYVHGPRVFTQKQHPTRSLDGNVQVACLGKTKFRLSCANTFKQDKTRILLFGKYENFIERVAKNIKKVLQSKLSLPACLSVCLLTK